MKTKNYYSKKVLLIKALLMLFYINKLLAQQPFSWAHTIQEVPQHASAVSYGDDITIDSDGFIITTGYSYGNFDFDPDPNAQAISNGDNSANVYVQKLDADGRYIWHKYFGNNGIVLAESVTTDSDNNIYVLGTFGGVLTFDNISITSNGSQDTFVLKMNSNGNVLWARNFGLSGNDNGNSIFYNKDTDELYFKGSYETVQTSPQISKDVYVFKLDPITGSDSWVQTYGSYQQENSYEITGDKDGNVYLTGTYFKKLNHLAFPTRKTIVNLLVAPLSNRLNTFVLKLENSGQIIWAKPINVQEDSPAAGVQANSLVVDNNQRVYLVGEFKGIIDFDPGSVQHLISNQGLKDVFVLSLMRTGDLRWFQRVNGTTSNNWAFDRGLAIDLDNQGGVIAGGISANIGLFISRYAVTNGNLDWIHGGGDLGVVNALVLGKCDEVYATGYASPGTLSSTTPLDLDPSSSVVFGPNVIGHINAFNLAWKWKSLAFDPSFTYEVCQNTLKVRGMIQPNGTNPNSDWHLIEYFPGTTLPEINRDHIVWWQQQAPYNYSTNEIVFNFQLQPGSFYYVKHGMYMNNSCAPWQEARKYAIQSNNIPCFKKAKISKSNKVINDVINIDLKIFPNPVNEVLNIKANERVNSYKVFNILGQLVLRGSDQTSSIDVSQLSLGNYILEVVTEKGNVTKQFVKN